jgi:hypothetical protein
MGAQKTNVPEKETATVRRDGEPLTSAAKGQQQKEAAADRHQTAAGERPPSAREGIGPVPLSASGPRCQPRDAVGGDLPQQTAAKADRVEATRGQSGLNCDPKVRLRLEARKTLARFLGAGTECLFLPVVRRTIQVANEDVMGSLTAVCRLDRELHEPSVTHTGGDPFERMERQRPTIGRSVQGSPDIDVERHSCSTTDMRAEQQARLAAMKKQLASIAAQPLVLWLSTAGAETLAPAETGLVPAQMQLVPAEADLVPAEADQGSTEEQLVPAKADLVPAEADQGSAEEQLVPAQMQMVPEEADLVPAETPLVSIRSMPADTARKRTPSGVTEDPGPVQPSKREAGAAAADAEATRPVESAETLTSPRSHAGMPAAVGEEPREPRVAAPSPPRKRCNVDGGDGWRDQLSRRNPGLIKEFR